MAMMSDQQTCHSFCEGIGHTLSTRLFSHKDLPVDEVLYHAAYLLMWQRSWEGLSTPGIRGGGHSKRNTQTQDSEDAHTLEMQLEAMKGRNTTGRGEVANSAGHHVL